MMELRAKRTFARGPPATRAASSPRSAAGAAPIRVGITLRAGAPGRPQRNHRRIAAASPGQAPARAAALKGESTSLQGDTVIS